jgi:hypothetical protein
VANLDRDKEKKGSHDCPQHPLKEVALENQAQWTYSQP